MYIGPSRDNNDVILAKKLALDIFGKELNPDLNISKIRKNLMWTQNDNIEPELIIISPEKDRVIGLIRIVKKILYKKKSEYLCAGVTSVCIDPKYRGKGLSKELFKATEKYCKEKGYAVSMLIGRRAADNFYTQFNFWGLSSYNRIQLKKNEIKNKSCDNIELHPLNADHLEIANELYEQNHFNCFGRMDRPPHYWKYILSLSKYGTIKHDAIIKDGKFFGYCIHEFNEVFEISLLNNQATKEVLSKISEENEKDIVLHINKNHQLTKSLVGLDLTYNHRQCEYGGHMIKIINAEKCIKLLKEDLKATLIKEEISSLKQETKEFDLSWHDNKLELKIKKNTNYDYKTTARLLGVESVFVVTTCAPNMIELNISLPDEF